MTFSPDVITLLSALSAESAAATTAGATGAWGFSYDVLLGLVSIGANGLSVYSVGTVSQNGNVLLFNNQEQIILQVNPQTNQILNADGTGPYDGGTSPLPTVFSAADISTFTPAVGTDPGTWTFLTGVCFVNENDPNSNFNLFTRVYSEAQHQIRYGNMDPAGLQSASNAIAQSIFSDILTNKALPSIEVIATQDANAAAATFFHPQNGQSELGGWAGAPFLAATGTTTGYNEYILHDPSAGYTGSSNAGDAVAFLSAMKSTAAALGVSVDANLMKTVLFDIIPEAGQGLIGTSQILANIVGLVNNTDTFLQSSYGLTGSLAVTSLPIPDPTLL